MIKTYCSDWQCKIKLVYSIYSDKVSEHDAELLSVDVYYEQGLILTACKDGIIKVWNNKKELLREIKFNEPIISALFMNQSSDIVVAHGG